MSEDKKKKKRRDECEGSRVRTYTLELSPQNIKIVHNGETGHNYLMVFDSRFTAEILAHHKDCKILLVAVVCCPEEEPASSDKWDDGTEHLNFHKC